MKKFWIDSYGQINYKLLTQLIHTMQIGNLPTRLFYLCESGPVTDIS